MTTFTNPYFPSDPQVEVSNTGDVKSFAHKTALVRWPKIYGDIVGWMKNSVDATPAGPKKTEGAKIQAELAALYKDVVEGNKVRPVPDDGSIDVKWYNDELKAWGDIDYLHMPWLFGECIVYRYIHSLYALSEHWKDYDIFLETKEKTFLTSTKGAQELSDRFQEVAKSLREHDERVLHPEAKKNLFTEMVLVSLWGNASDLSLITETSVEELERVQAHKAIDESFERIVVNNVDNVYSFFESHPNSRVDIVLDNAAFELFADLIFASYLLEAGYAKQIVLRPKNFSWFVSDVLTSDVDSLLSMIKGLEFGSFLYNYWAGLFKSEKIVWKKHWFWTTAHPFGRISHFAPELAEELSTSDLLIFKGDLNYRKLTYDAHWDHTTPFKTAANNFLTSGKGQRLLSLRTNKADVVVGLQSAKQIKELDEKTNNTWTSSGEYAVLTFADAKQ